MYPGWKGTRASMLLVIVMFVCCVACVTTFRLFLFCKTVERSVCNAPRSNVPAVFTDVEIAWIVMNGNVLRDLVIISIRYKYCKAYQFQYSIETVKIPTVWEYAVRPFSARSTDIWVRCTVRIRYNNSIITCTGISTRADSWLHYHGSSYNSWYFLHGIRVTGAFIGIIMHVRSFLIHFLTPRPLMPGQVVTELWSWQRATDTCKYAVRVPYWVRTGSSSSYSLVMLSRLSY